MTIDLSKEIQLVARVSSVLLKDEHIRIVRILGKGSVNKVYIVEGSNAKLVVRMGDQDESLNEYKKEAWCIEKAAARNVPVTTVLDVGVIEEHAYIIQTYSEA